MTCALWKYCLTAGTLTLLAACTPLSQTDTRTPDALFSLQPETTRQALEQIPDATPYLKKLLNDPSSKEVRLVDVNPAQVAGTSKTLTVPLPEGGSVRFNLIRINNAQGGMTGWIGDVPSDRKQRFPSPSEVGMDPFNWVSLLRDGDSVVGDIHVKGQAYRLDPLGGGLHALVKVDATKLPPNGEPLHVAHNASAPPDATKNTSPACRHSTIRLLLVNSKESRELPSWQARHIQQIQNANLYMENSDVAITYEIAGFLDADYSDKTGDSTSKMLDYMSSTTHPLGVAIAAERDRLKADMVNLMIDNSSDNVCGRANLTATKETAMSVTLCYSSIAHELGHNLGALHDWEPGTEVPYMFGYRNPSKTFHTVMLDHDPIPYFSNPRLTFEGEPIGTVEREDVARRFNERREIVENFYP